MYNRFFVSVITILLTTFYTHAQNAKLFVKDEHGQSLPGTTVKVIKIAGQKTTSVSLTNEQGEAEIVLSQFPAEIEVSNLGFETTIVTLKNGNEPQQVTLKSKYTGLNEVVVTGVGRPTKLDQAVSVYRIITAADMRAQGAVTLNDALRNQLGININNDGMLGANINMRGLGGSNIKILVDGLPLNGREGSNIDLGQINLNNIERAEVVQGPMNVMYGSDAIGGVINLITKTNRKELSVGANAYYESIGRYNFGADIAKSIGRHNVSLSFGRNLFQGWDPRYDTVRNPLWRPKLQYLGNLKYTYKLNDDATLTLASDYVNEMLYIKGSAADFSQFNLKTNDVEFNTQRATNRFIAKWRTGTNGYWESNNSYGLYHRTGTTYVTDLSTLNRELSAATGAQSVARFDNITSRTTYNNKAGIFDYTFGYDINAEFANSAEKISGSSKFIGDYAVFLSTNVTPVKQLTIQPAFRFIHNTAYNAPVSPSLSILYKPVKKVQFRTSYSRGFRAPTLKELYLSFHDANHSIDGNPDLKAEFSHHFQVSGGYTAFEKDKSSFTTSLNGFYDDVRNQIAIGKKERTPDLAPGEDPGNIYKNIGRTRIMVWQWNNELVFKSFRATAGLSYTQSFATASIENGTIVYTTPNFNFFEFNNSLRYDVQKLGLGIATFFKYTGSQPLVGSIEGGSIFTDTLESFMNIDASVEKNLWKERLFLTVGVRNLLDNQIANSINGVSGGGGGGHSSGGAALLTTGRSYFATLRFQLTK